MNPESESDLTETKLDVEGVEHADSVDVGICNDCGQPVIIFNDEDGDPFAVGHLEVEQVPEFTTLLHRVVDKVKARAH